MFVSRQNDVPNGSIESNLAACFHGMFFLGFPTSLAVSRPCSEGEDSPTGIPATERRVGTEGDRAREQPSLWA